MISRSCDIIYNNEDFKKDSFHEINLTREHRKLNLPTNEKFQDRMRKKNKVPIVKRLCKGRRTTIDNPNRKNINKINLERAGRTRSGRVYSPIL